MSVRFVSRVGARVAPAPAPAARDGTASAWPVKDTAVPSPSGRARRPAPARVSATPAAVEGEEQTRGGSGREEESLRAFMFLSFWGPHT